MKALTRQWIVYNIATLLSIGCACQARAQQWFNIFDHVIESPPKLFTFCSSEPASKVFRAAINRDNVSIGEMDYRVRTYSVPDFGTFVRVTCIYSQDAERKWRCERARFFHAYQGSIFKMGTAHLLCSTILFNPRNPDMAAQENRSNWKNTDQGVWIAGNPPWVSAFLSSNEYVIVAKLADFRSADPASEIANTADIFGALDDEAASEPTNSSEAASPGQTIRGPSGPQTGSKDVPNLKSIYD